MRISRRPSGGRGEYEISESAPSGVTPHKLEERRLHLVLGKGLSLDTGTTLRIQGGKPRLRLLEGVEIHLHRQFAAALLMPHPVRQDVALGAGAPVVQRNRYAIEHIQLSNAWLVGKDTARLKAQTAVLQNKTYAAEEFAVSDRATQVRRVWEKAADFPDPLPALPAEHQALVMAEAPLPERAERVVYEIQAAVAQASEDLGVLYAANTDVLPALIQFLDSIESEPPPFKPDEIEQEQVEIKRRLVKQWRHQVAYRGAASARFRREVREAYNSTCIVCGRRFPKTNVSSAGVDAAHILPWADYDLDHISNGICACKLHHWAFDEGLIRILYKDGKYFVEIPDDVPGGLAGTGFALDALHQVVGEIPDARLPKMASKRPNPKFLEMLEEALE